MPDFVNEPFAYCESVENFVATVGDYVVTHGHTPFGECHYGWQCTCKGFKFRKYCKHIEIAKQDFCGWDEFVDGDGVKHNTCPSCGSALKSRMVAV